MAGQIERIYSLSPTWLQNIFISLKGWQFRYRRADERLMRERYEILLKSQYWTEEVFKKYQTEQMRRLLKTAFQHVPYYQEMKKQLRCEAEDFKHPEDIRKFPILEKSQVRGNEHLFLNQTIDPKKVSKGSTSGTTGTPLRLFDTRESFSRRWAFVMRLRNWAGVEDPFSCKLAHFTGRKIIPPGRQPKDRSYWRWNKPGNTLLFSSYHISAETIADYVQALTNFQPELITGYPSAILAITRLSHAKNLRLPTPKAIITTAETLLPEHRRDIVTAFRCRLFDQYAASEPSCFWCDCEYGVMHENPEYGISEIINERDEPVKEGELGDILCTSFLNTTMILIRYRVGDMAVMGPLEVCSCGRRMPRIAGIEGRRDDIFYVPGKGYFSRLGAPFRGLSNIIESQVIQEELQAFKILLVPDQNYAATIGEQLIQNLKAVLGNDINIKLELVNHIERGPNGKFRGQISKVKHLYPEQI